MAFARLAQRFLARTCMSSLRSASSTISIPRRVSTTSSMETTPSMPPNSSTTSMRCCFSWVMILKVWKMESVTRTALMGRIKSTRVLASSSCWRRADMRSLFSTKPVIWSRVRS